jgi:hypothetical protein
MQSRSTYHVFDSRSVLTVSVYISSIRDRVSINLVVISLIVMSEPGKEAPAKPEQENGDGTHAEHPNVNVDPEKKEGLYADP